MPHRHWREVTAAADLARALRSDPRSDVGRTLKNITVVRRDASGRAETILLEGDNDAPRERVGLEDHRRAHARLESAEELAL
ncbi:MAG: hypothetical protein WKF30_08740 [Pyrinomonadaceae bacterium]